MTTLLAPSGYDADFLGLPVPLPAPSTADRVVRRLDYTHFSVLLDPVRRLAATTGVNLDGSRLLDLERPDDWHLDPRVPAEEQTGEEVYDRNNLDRGHLVRRRDPVWGEAAVAAQANDDTFSFTNAAPQASNFNQSKELWLGLEDYLLTHAQTFQTRLSIFTGPVLAADDPVYRGVAIPRRFYKVAAWSTPAAEGAETPPLLSATGYVLDQTPDLDDVDLETARQLAAGNPPPLGPYRTYQVPISDIAAITVLDLGPLQGADRFVPPVQTPSDGTPARWVLLTSPAGIRF